MYGLKHTASAMTSTELAGTRPRSNAGARNRMLEKSSAKARKQSGRLRRPLCVEVEGVLRSVPGLASQKPQTCEPGAKQQERCGLGHRPVLLERVYNLNRTAPVGRRR